MAMTAEETVFGIPELRRYILGYYLEKNIPQRKKPKTCKDKAKETSRSVTTVPAQCCCVFYCFVLILCKTRCLSDYYFYGTM
jgi:hypothetical protein